MECMPLYCIIAYKVKGRGIKTKLILGGSMIKSHLSFQIFLSEALNLQLELRLK
jgi:hypothetical protein